MSMARLGGLSTEPFPSARECLSAASGGLAAILRDQKTGTRAPVLLGLSSQTTPTATTRSVSISPARSLASSPIDSSGILDADDADDYKEEDICGADVRESRKSQSLKDHLGLLHSASHGFDVRNHGYEPTFWLGFSHAHTHQQHHSRTHHDVYKQQMCSAVDGVASRPARQHLVDKGAGLSDAITPSATSVRLSPLSKVSNDTQPRHLPAAGKALTPSWTIPARAKTRTYGDAARDSMAHQSAPVNVQPSWSKILKQPAASGASSSDGVDKFSEDADSERLIPPHEFLAREYAQSQKMTSSVCEGHGRTLKGRDMRRVRNAVWQQTGFVD